MIRVLLQLDVDNSRSSMILHTKVVVVTCKLHTQNQIDSVSSVVVTMQNMVVVQCQFYTRATQIDSEVTMQKIVHVKVEVVTVEALYTQIQTDSEVTLQKIVHLKVVAVYMQCSEELISVVELYSLSRQ